MACHAVLYKFDMETQGWEKEDMEVGIFNLECGRSLNSSPS